MVSITITGRNEVTSRQKEHAREKAAKLSRYFNGILRIEVMLEKSIDRARVELVISVKKGSQIVCHQEEKELYAAIDLVLDKAEKQLTRFKEKLQAKRSSQRPDFEPPIGASAPEDEFEFDTEVFDDDG